MDKHMNQLSNTNITYINILTKSHYCAISVRPTLSSVGPLRKEKNSAKMLTIGSKMGKELNGLTANFHIPKNHSPQKEKPEPLLYHPLIMIQGK